MWRADPDARRIIGAQGLRAVGYGCTSVLLGTLLAAYGYSPLATGALLAVTVAGTAAAALVIGRLADSWGRRRCYLVINVGFVCAGVTVAVAPSILTVVLVAATGLLSTDVVDNGPATTLEQPMLAGADARVAGKSGARIYGLYNMVASLAGALGALTAAVPSVLGAPDTATWPFLILVPVGSIGAWLASRLTPNVEVAPTTNTPGVLCPSKARVHRLAALFAVDAAGGGLVTSSFLAYYLTTRYGASTELLGVLFFCTALLQAVSVWVAPRLADRIGLVPTMVATHLPSNVLLAALAFAPSLVVAVPLLLARASLSQMDVPTRQALVMQTVTPPERTAAAAETNAARYTIRPAGTMLGGVLQHLAVGLPLLVAGIVKGGYDIALWIWVRRTQP